MILYQLCAVGKSALTGRHNKIFSKKVFRDRILAEQHKPEFTKYVTSSFGCHDIFYLSPKGLKIEIGPIEIYDE